MIGKMRSLKPLLGLAAALLVGASSMMIGDGTRVSAANEVTVWTGGGKAGIAVNIFLPNSVTVNEGDTVTFVNPYIEPHTVSYTVGTDHIPELEAAAPINPGAAASFDGSATVSSGFLGEDDEFAVKFAKSGVYTFFCAIHPGMEIDVTVSATPGFIAPINYDHLQTILDQGIAIGEAADAAVVVPGPRTNADGTRTWTIPSSPALPYREGSVDVLRFIPDVINIGVGDTVTWENNTFVPHTITIFAGPPPANFNPVVPTVTSTAYQPGTFVNSGFMGMVPDWPGGTRFSLSFPVAGSYNYICVLHADQGMVGVVNVGGAGITPPSTGSGGLIDRSSGSWMMLAGVAFLLASFGSAAVMARRSI